MTKMLLPGLIMWYTNSMIRKRHQNINAFEPAMIEVSIKKFLTIFIDFDYQKIYTFAAYPYCSV